MPVDYEAESVAPLLMADRLPSKQDRWVRQIQHCECTKVLSGKAGEGIGALGPDPLRVCERRCDCCRIAVYFTA